MSLLKNNTPIDQFNDRIFIKREDLCIEPPSFSKMRGVYSHLESREEDVIGCLDTFHSKAGWGTSLVCKHLCKQSVVFYPVYKDDTILRDNQVYARKNGAKLVGIPAGRSCILYHHAKKYLEENYPGAYMLPNALKLSESVEETAQEVATVPNEFFNDTTWVVSASSGTIAAGVYSGLARLFKEGTVLWGVELVVHLGYSRPLGAVRGYMDKYLPEGIVAPITTIIDEGYDYKDKIKFPCPFPCNPYYDLKAWAWLNNPKTTHQFKSKILFWNIGA